MQMQQDGCGFAAGKVKWVKEEFAWVSQEKDNQLEVSE